MIVSVERGPDDPSAGPMKFCSSERLGGALPLEVRRSKPAVDIRQRQEGLIEMKTATAAVQMLSARTSRRDQVVLEHLPAGPGGNDFPPPGVFLLVGQSKRKTVPTFPD